MEFRADRRNIDGDTENNSASSNDLKQNCLSYTEVLAQSVSVIAPSTVPAAILGLIFATAGNGTWLSFLLGMVGMVLVSLNINQFARRSASPGSLYNYIVKGLGPTSGVMGGWALLLGYTLTGMSTLCGFAIFANVLLAPYGIQLPILLLFAVGAFGACYIAFRDVQLSAKTTLLIEGVVIVAMLVLGFYIWGEKGLAVDTAQLTLEGATPSGVLIGIVLVVFGFSGFESSTSLGDEAKDPLRSIPRSVTQSVLISGFFFIFMAYVTIVGFNGSSVKLGETEAPLNVLANELGLGFIGTLINIGILLSFFACTLACINSTARVVFSMARYGLVYDVLGEAHTTNKTPYVAVIISAAVTFALPAAVYIAGITPFEGQGLFGTLCSYGFLLVYVLISISAPVYLQRIGKLTWQSVLYSVLGTGFMILPFLGTVGIPGSSLFPQPEYPDNVLPWVFVGYMTVGLVWLIAQRIRHPSMIPAMRAAIENVDLKFAQAAIIPDPVVVKAERRIP